MNVALWAALIGAGASIIAAMIASANARRAERLGNELQRQHDAIMRMRTAVGSLRLELFLSVRSVVRRLTRYASHPHAVETQPSDGSWVEHHDGGLMIYRLLRPLAVSGLIERDLHFADLSLEASTKELLHFNHAAFEMLTGRQVASADRYPLPDSLMDFGDRFHPEWCWGSREFGSNPETFQRFRASYLRRAALELVKCDRGRNRCMDHAEFLDRWEDPDRYKTWHQHLEPVKATLHGLDPAGNPILWLRLVGYTYVCKWFFDRHRRGGSERSRPHWYSRRNDDDIPYAGIEFDVASMIVGGTKPDQEPDQHLKDFADRYQERFDQIIEHAL